MIEESAVRVFVNERVVEVPAWATVAHAVLAFDEGLFEALRRGDAYVTDGVGRPIEEGGAVQPGAIFRVVRRAAGGGAARERCDDVDA